MAFLMFNVPKNGIAKIKAINNEKITNVSPKNVIQKSQTVKYYFVCKKI